MSESPDHDRVRQLLERIDEITKESEGIRRQIESIRSTSNEWPDRRRTSRTFDDGKKPSNLAPSDN